MHSEDINKKYQFLKQPIPIIIMSVYSNSIASVASSIKTVNFKQIMIMPANKVLLSSSFILGSSFLVEVFCQAALVSLITYYTTFHGFVQYAITIPIINFVNSLSQFFALSGCQTIQQKLLCEQQVIARNMLVYQFLQCFIHALVYNLVFAALGNIIQNLLLELIDVSLESSFHSDFISLMLKADILIHSFYEQAIGLQRAGNHILQECMLRISNAAVVLLSYYIVTLFKLVYKQPQSLNDLAYIIIVTDGINIVYYLYSYVKFTQKSDDLVLYVDFKLLSPFNKDFLKLTIITYVKELYYNYDNIFAHIFTIIACLTAGNADVVVLSIYVQFMYYIIHNSCSFIMNGVINSSRSIFTLNLQMKRYERVFSMLTEGFTILTLINLLICILCYYFTYNLIQLMLGSTLSMDYIKQYFSIASYGCLDVIFNIVYQIAKEISLIGNHNIIKHTLISSKIISVTILFIVSFFVYFPPSEIMLFSNLVGDIFGIFGFAMLLRKYHQSRKQINTDLELQNENKDNKLSIHSNKEDEIMQLFDLQPMPIRPGGETIRSDSYEKNISSETISTSQYNQNASSKLQSEPQMQSGQFRNDSFPRLFTKDINALE